MDHRKRLVLNATTIDGPSALDLANARKSRFHSSFRRTTTNAKSFAQPGDHHSCQASNTGSALKKKRNFQKLLVVVVGVRKKMPTDGAQFSKRAPRHRRNQKPQGSNVWRQILQKRGKQKTLRNEHNSGKKRDNFELRTKIVP